MLRRFGFSGLLALSVPAALVISLGIASASSHVAGPVALTVIEHSSTDKVVDVGKKGDSSGDILTFHNNLYDATDTARVGTNQGQCVREDPKAGTWECWWTTSLKDGQITVEGPFDDTPRHRLRRDRRDRAVRERPRFHESPL